ncbi:hypothetical protein CBL_20742, partial [Carabus blaptoides fortunei]
RKYNHRHQRHNAYLYKPTTFFPDMEVPVFMSENDDDLPGPSVAPSDQSTEQANMNNVKVETDQPSINLEPNLDSVGISLMHIKLEPNSENDTSTSDSDSAESTSNDSDGNCKTE